MFWFCEPKKPADGPELEVVVDMAEGKAERPESPRVFDCEG